MIGMSEQLTCRDRERDISEKIVLGLPDSNARSGEVQFDQRLFDQSKVRNLLLFFIFFHSHTFSWILHAHGHDKPFLSERSKGN